MNKAIGYIRVSTEQQAEEGISLAAQKARIAAWCEANDYQLADVFIDAGISGGKMDNRQGLKDALAAVKKGNALVVYSLSRLARSTKDTLVIAEQLDSKKADLVSLSEKLDTTTAAGRMMFKMLAVLADFERDLVAERTKSALSHKKAIGEVYSPTPFGFQAIEGRLKQVESEAAVVAEILAMRNEGATFGAIADSLNSRGIEGKRGGKWFPSTVRYLIQRQEA
jgi:site-specific DNA recombinase